MRFYQGEKGEPGGLGLAGLKGPQVMKAIIV